MLPNVRRNLVAIGPPVVVALLGIVTILGVRRERADTHWVTHTQSVRLALATIFTGLRDAEAGSRGFVLTGDTASLLAYRTQLPNVVRAIDSLRAMTADNPLQLRRIATLDTLAAAKIVELHRIVVLAAAGKRDSAIAVVLQNQSVKLVNRIRSLITAMDADEATLLASRLGGVERQRRLVIGVVVGGTILAAALSLLALQLLARSTAQLEEKTIQLEASRDALLAAADQLRARTSAAEEANRAKAQFLTTMSHELRTPLNAIDGYAELLEMGLRGPITSEQAQDLARIRRSQRHLLALVNDVLNFARLEAGRLEWQIANVSLEDVLQGVEALLRPQIEGKAIAYRRDGCDHGLLVRADAEKLRQIIVNLVGNAHKFTAPGGTIDIHCEPTDQQVTIRVVDTGRGIPADKLSTIFDPFVQVERHLTPDSQQGIGLGLAISRDLARGMGGELVVQSTHGSGSEFSLTIPRAQRG